MNHTPDEHAELAATAATSDAQAPQVPPSLPAALLVSVAPDKLQAHLTWLPASEHEVADREQVLAALQRSGVVHGITLDGLEAALAARRCEGLLVAKGQPAIDGQDVEFELLIPDAKDRRPKLDDDASVDYRELGLFVSVRPGTPLMRRKPATPGTPGKNVLGQAVPPKPGQDQPFAPQLPGAVLDPANELQLLAAITGLPVQVPCGVTVEPVLTVQDVDLHTGNLSFEGSIHVAGDVHSGMKVRAQGDITVAGVVEAAEIVAGGSVTIQGGVIGHSEWCVGAGETHDTAKVTAGGAVYTRFAEHAIIEAGSTIHALDASRQSLLRANQKVVVGKDDGHSGHIIGGRVVATLLVQAGFIGSTANVPTVIEVGRNPLLTKKLEELDEQLRLLSKEQADLALLLGYAKSHPQRLAEAVVNKARLTVVQVTQQISACHQDRQVYLDRLGLAADATVVVGQRLYGGVTVKLGELGHTFPEERAAGTLRRVGDTIGFD